MLEEGKRREEKYMRTYPEDEYDYQGDIDEEEIYFGGFKYAYEDKCYSIWLEDFLMRMFKDSGYKSEDDIIEKFKEIGNGIDTYLENICMMFKDRKIRENDPLLEKYPINLLRDRSNLDDEEIRSINEWEIHFIAGFAQKTLDQTKGYVKPSDYIKMLKEMKPYKNYFLERTWNLLDESKVSEYLSIRIDTNIAWYDSYEADNIVYDINYLTWGDTKNNRFLSIDANLNSSYWENIKFQG